MDKQDIPYLEKQIEDMLQKHTICEADLDYSIIESRKQEWELLSRIGKNIVFVFDCFTQKFISVSGERYNHYGLNLDDLIEKGHAALYDSIYPDDIKPLILIRKKVYEFLHNLLPEEKKNYKLIHELRLKNKNGDYVRIMEQEQVLELDKKGNIWLTLSVIDIDASHEVDTIRSHMYNILTGEQFFFDLSDTLDEKLTSREINILKLMKSGLLSKEISDSLGISVNTVNVHKQNIFHKLDVDNAMEAVNKAKKLGMPL